MRLRTPVLALLALGSIALATQGCSAPPPPEETASTSQKNVLDWFSWGNRTEDCVVVARTGAVVGVTVGAAVGVSGCVVGAATGPGDVAICPYSAGAGVAIAGAIAASIDDRGGYAICRSDLMGIGLTGVFTRALAQTGFSNDAKPISVAEIPAHVPQPGNCTMAHLSNIEERMVSAKCDYAHASGNCGASGCDAIAVASYVGGVAHEMLCMALDLEIAPCLVGMNAAHIPIDPSGLQTCQQKLASCGGTIMAQQPTCWEGGPFEARANIAGGAGTRIYEDFNVIGPAVPYCSSVNVLGSPKRGPDGECYYPIEMTASSGGHVGKTRAWVPHFAVTYAPQANFCVPTEDGSNAPECWASGAFEGKINKATPIFGSSNWNAQTGTLDFCSSVTVTGGARKHGSGACRYPVQYWSGGSVLSGWVDSPAVTFAPDAGFCL